MAVHPPTIPARIGAYDVLGILGRGGMGVVYLARDSRLERTVAIKALPETLAADPVQRARFDREAKLLATFNHPNIGGIHGLEDEGGVRYLILEHIDGVTLAEHLKAGRMAIDEALRVSLQVIKALDVAHEAGIIHRDLKPGNIMLTRKQHVKVLDFGLARQSSRIAGSASPEEAADVTLTAPGHAAGTPGYMSPEQLRAVPQGPVTDIFAFGSVLFECLAGARAFPGSATEAIAATILRDPDWSRLPEDLPAEIRDLLARCLEKEPEARLGNIAEARDVIMRLPGFATGTMSRRATAGLPLNHLPRLLTSFVGRRRELDEIQRLLGETRLVTLTGPGGGGKTRLALKIMERNVESFPNGAWFLDLSPITDPERVAPALVQALGLREDPGRSAKRLLLDHVGGRTALLLLDNCEHLLPDLSEIVSDLILGCPHIRVLATSLQSLGISGERMYIVPSLTVPGEADAGSAASAAAFESVKLFLERASLAGPGFDWNDEAAPVVSEICRRLDGIPLAIELAAARVKVLSVEQILARLNDRFRLLTGGGDLSRHQTLLATIQWSYDHLVPPEQELFRQLAVFAGGWTLEAAAAVSGPDADEFDVLDLLTRLVDKSLVAVIHARDGLPRYRYLESVRQYAGQKLAECGETPVIRGRHLRYFADFVERSRAHHPEPENAKWLRRLDAEHQNLLEALAFCDDADNGPETGLHMAALLWRFWDVRGHYATGSRALSEALNRPGAETPGPARANALYWTGFLNGRQGHTEESLRLIEESLDMSRAVGDRRGEGRALNGLGTHYTRTGDIESSRRYRREYLDLCRELGEAPLIATALNNLGDAEMQAGNFAAARPLFEESLALGREVGEGLDLAMPLQNIGFVALRQRDLPAARRALGECVSVIGTQGARYLGAFALEYTGYLAAALGEATFAARLLGAAGSLRAGIGYAFAASEAAEHEVERAGLRERLGEPAFERAWSEGGAMSFEEAFEETSRWYRGEK